MKDPLFVPVKDPLFVPVKDTLPFRVVRRHGGLELGGQQQGNSRVKRLWFLGADWLRLRETLPFCGAGKEGGSGMRKTADATVHLVGTRRNRGNQLAEPRTGTESARFGGDRSSLANIQAVFP
jgi:hypothetical protein